MRAARSSRSYLGLGRPFFVRLACKQASQVVEGTAHRKSRPVEHMGVNHGSRDIRVAKQFLYRADIRSPGQQVGGEGVAQGMGGNPLGKVGRPGRFADRALERGINQVMASPSSTGLSRNQEAKRRAQPR